MSDKITPIALQSQDNSRWSPETMLLWLSKQPELAGFQKGVVILLDSENGKYRIRTAQSNLRHSESVALLEVVKNDFIKLLG
jgi:hypothetical protein